MPRGDGTGPMGMGPMTGRGFGYCAGYPMPGLMNAGMGCGWGGGPGRGPVARGARRAWRRWFRGAGFRGPMRMGPGGMPPGAPFFDAVDISSPEAEKEYLKGCVETLQAQLDDAKKRLEELAADKKS